MSLRAYRWAPLATLAAALAAGLSVQAQVFVVGEKTATSSIKTDFAATHVELPDRGLSELGRRDLLRNLEAEQGFAHRVLPVGTILQLHANGNLNVAGDEYRKLVYKKGQFASPGDRVMITRLDFKGDRIVIDLNGGPYVPHRFLRHVQVGVGGASTPNYADDGAVATGCRIELLFEGGIPDVSAPEVKALLEPIVDFNVKSGETVYADTLPAPLKTAVLAHDVLVGMDRHMVLASVGAPESRVRESAADGTKYEEWIYGHQPQTVRFVRFSGDHVSLVKIAALGKPMEIHDHDETVGYVPPLKTRTVRLSDAPLPSDQAQPPTLLKAGETTGVNTNAAGRVQYPVPKAGTGVPAAPAAGTPADTPAPEGKPVQHLAVTQ